MKQLTSLDFSGNQIQNAVAHPLSAAPSSPKLGQFYFNTTGNVLTVWNGSAWRPADAGALTDGSIPIAALATNPLARANHTGTQTAATISDLAATVQGYRLDQFAVPTANVSFGSVRLLNLADPTGAQDAATKNYVDGAVQSAAAGIDSKPSVRAIATSNITLSATQTVDGVALAVGDRVLAAAQTTGSANGVYVVASGAWSRAADADQTGEITPGAFWFVEEGTTYGKTQWRCNNTGTITLGTTAITIVQFGAASSYTASLGVQLVGSDFRLLLNSTFSGLVANASGVAVDTTVIARKFSTTITSDGSALTYSVTHNLGTTDVIVQVYDSSGNQIGSEVARTSANVATIGFGIAPANATTYRVTVVG